HGTSQLPRQIRHLSSLQRQSERAVNFAKIVFWVAGIWGFLVLTPLYFMLDIIGQKDPPPITHPGFFYGFVGVALVWQVVFIIVVISNREGAPGLQRAESRGIKTRVVPSKGLEREVYDRQVAAALDEYRVDLICLAGYMRLLSPFFVAKYPNRILNIHPSLLP